MDTSNEEDNWSCVIIEEESHAPPLKDIAGPSMPCLGPIKQSAQSKVNIGEMGQYFSCDPPEGHWGYPIIEEEAMVIPLQEANRAPEDFPNSTMHILSEEHMNLLLDIHKDATGQLFHQENINY